MSYSPQTVRFILLFAIASLTACEKSTPPVYSSPCGLQSQDNYYWYYTEKIKVEPALYILLLISKDSSTHQSVNQWLSQHPSVRSAGETGRNLAVVSLHQDERKRMEFLDAVVRHFPNVVASQSITYQGSTFNVLNQVDLQPKADVDIQTVIQRFGESIKLLRSSKYNTYLFEVAPCQNAMDVANRIQESGLVEWCTANFQGGFRPF